MGRSVSWLNGETEAAHVGKEFGGLASKSKTCNSDTSPTPAYVQDAPKITKFGYIFGLISKILGQEYFHKFA